MSAHPEESCMKCAVPGTAHTGAALGSVTVPTHAQIREEVVPGSSWWEFTQKSPRYNTGKSKALTTLLLSVVALTLVLCTFIMSVSLMLWHSPRASPCPGIISIFPADSIFFDGELHHCCISFGNKAVTGESAQRSGLYIL